MIKRSTIRRQPVQLRPSRIRREPFRQPEQRKSAPVSHEREIWLGVTGVVLFAVAIAMATFGISVLTGPDGSAVAASPQAFGACEGGANCIIDPETVRIGGDTLKIAGMVAPQLQAARCSDERDRAMKALQGITQLLNSGKVTTAGNVTEPNGETRTAVLVDGRDVGAAMVAQGLAREPAAGRPDWC